MKFRCKVSGMRRGLAIWILLVLGFGCGNKDAKPTREDCTKVADHIADLIISQLSTHPDELWDSLAETGQTGLPKDVTKESLAAYIATPEGKTWIMQRRGYVRTGTEQGIDKCVTSASAKQVKCLLAAKSRVDVNACDATK